VCHRTLMNSSGIMPNIPPANNVTTESYGQYRSMVSADFIFILNLERRLESTSLLTYNGYWRGGSAQPLPTAHNESCSMIV